MKWLSTVLTLAFLAVITIIALPTQADPTITLTNPTNGTTLHCVVPVQATINSPPSPPSSWANAHLKITDNLGSTTDIPMTSPQGGMINNTSFSYSWDTMAVVNGTYYLQAYFSYGTSTGTGTAYSGLVTVTVQNGFSLNVGASSAKITQPTTTMTSNGEPFTISSDHKVVWTRYDDCATYSANYTLYLQTTYPAGVQTIDSKSDSYMLPKQLGDCPYPWTLSKDFTAAGPNAQYQDYAFTEGQRDNTDPRVLQAAQDSNTFSVAIPSK